MPVVTAFLSATLFALVRAPRRTCTAAHIPRPLVLCTNTSPPRLPPPSPLALPPTSSAPSRAPPRKKDTAWTAVGCEVLLGLAALGLGALLPGPGAQGPGFAHEPLGQVRLGLLALLPFTSFFFALTGSGRGARLSKAFRPLLESCSVADVCVFCAAAAGGEELFFRGVLQEGVARVLGDGIGIASASLVFGCLHAYSVEYVALATLAGGLFGSLYVAGGDSVIAPFTLHFLYDFLAIIVLRLQWEIGDVETAGRGLAIEALVCEGDEWMKENRFP